MLKGFLLLATFSSELSVASINFVSDKNYVHLSSNVEEDIQRGSKSRKLAELKRKYTQENNQTGIEMLGSECWSMYMTIIYV